MEHYTDTVFLDWGTLIEDHEAECQAEEEADRIAKAMFEDFNREYDLAPWAFED